MKRFTICYDISDTKKRNRLVKILEEYGQRVQYSIFEFFITEAQHVRLIQNLKKGGFFKTSTKKTDKITIYEFDENPKSKIKRYGKKPSIDKDNLLYV